MFLQLPADYARAVLIASVLARCLHVRAVYCAVQEGGAAVGMALSEPLGGGMFASNVVFGLVVLIASKQQVRPSEVSTAAYMCAQSGSSLRSSHQLETVMWPAGMTINHTAWACYPPAVAQKHNQCRLRPTAPACCLASASTAACTGCHSACSILEGRWFLPVQPDHHCFHAGRWQGKLLAAHDAPAAVLACAAVQQWARLEAGLSAAKQAEHQQQGALIALAAQRRPTGFVSTESAACHLTDHPWLTHADLTC